MDAAQQRDICEDAIGQYKYVNEYCLPKYRAGNMSLSDLHAAARDAATAQRHAAHANPDRAGEWSSGARAMDRIAQMRSL